MDFEHALPLLVGHLVNGSIPGVAPVMMMASIGP